MATGLSGRETKEGMKEGRMVAFLIGGVGWLGSGRIWSSWRRGNCGWSAVCFCRFVCSAATVHAIWSCSLPASS